MEICPFPSGSCPCIYGGRGGLGLQQADYNSHVSFLPGQTTSSLYFSRHNSERTCFSLGAVLTAVRTEDERGKGQKTTMIIIIIQNKKKTEKEKELETKQTTEKKREMIDIFTTEAEEK